MTDHDDSSPPEAPTGPGVSANAAAPKTSPPNPLAPPSLPDLPWETPPAPDPKVAQAVLRGAPRAHVSPAPFQAPPPLPLGYAPPNEGGSFRGPSRMLATRRCGRLWLYRWGLGWREKVNRYPGESAPATLHGSLLHDAILDWYAERMAKPPAWYVPGQMPSRIWAQCDGDQVLYRDIMDAAATYYERYAEEREMTETLTAETEFAVRLGDLCPDICPPDLRDEIVTCQNDRTYRASDGVVWVWDLKTQGRGKCQADGSLKPWDEWSGEFSMHAQAHVNLRITRHLMPDENVAGFLIERLTRHRTDDGIFDLSREKVPTSDVNMTGVDEFIVESVEREASYRKRLAEGRAPATSFACFAGYPCDYLPVCAAPTLDEANRVLASRFEQKPHRIAPEPTPVFKFGRRGDGTW